jgi:hypothetical protein
MIWSRRRIASTREHRRIRLRWESTPAIDIYILDGPVKGSNLAVSWSVLVKGSNRTTPKPSKPTTTRNSAAC